MPPVQNNSDSQFLYGLLPALPVILGGIIISWQIGVTFYGVLVYLLLVLLGMGCGLFLWRSHVHSLALINSHWAEDENSKITAVASYTTELERLLLSISPILSQHVMVSRESTEQEIISLASRFADMANALQQIVDSTDTTLEGRSHFYLDSVINSSHDLLQPVLASLRQHHQKKYGIKDELQQLSSDINSLSINATQVNNLYLKLLSLKNTENQEPTFAVILGSLASDVLEIDQQLSNKIYGIKTKVEVALSTSEISVQADNLTLSQTEANIDQILFHLNLASSHYHDNVKALRNNAEQIRVEIDEVLITLQFQDRVSQILSQVESNLLNLQKTIETIQQQGSNRDGNMLQVDAAVEHIEESYKSVNSLHCPSDDSDDLTFF